jgi:hypothetical protein
MKTSTPAAIDRFTALTTSPPHDPPGVRTRATCDHATIRRWAVQHAAEPATGQESASGPAVRNVNDTGAGIRFNFPGFARYRTIAWREWFDHFEQHELMFVYEDEDPEQVAELARARWLARGGADGHDQEDWFEAERELRLRRRDGSSPNVRYRMIKRETGSSVSVQAV